jgi:hypothetical protein
MGTHLITAEVLMENLTLTSQDSELKAALLQRGQDASAVGLRDLKRYYALLNHHLLETSWTENEAQLICEALRDYQFEDDLEQARMIWKQVHTAVRQDHLDQKWNVNRETFHTKIQALNHLEAVALVDAVERYWIREQLHPQESPQTRLMHVNFVKCCDFSL